MPKILTPSGWKSLNESSVYDLKKHYDDDHEFNKRMSEFEASKPSRAEALHVHNTLEPSQAKFIKPKHTTKDILQQIHDNRVVTVRSKKAARYLNPKNAMMRELGNKKI